MTPKTIVRAQIELLIVTPPEGRKMKGSWPQDESMCFCKVTYPTKFVRKKIWISTGQFFFCPLKVWSRLRCLCYLLKTCFFIIFTYMGKGSTQKTSSEVFLCSWTTFWIPLSIPHTFWKIWKFPVRQLFVDFFDMSKKKSQNAVFFIYIKIKWISHIFFFLVSTPKGDQYTPPYGLR